MRQPFAHEAVLPMDLGTDTAVPGAAVTLELCGGWEHPPPCPMAPHHSAVEVTAEGNVRVRILFAAEAAQEVEVRGRIDRALNSGELDGLDGNSTQWRVLSAEVSAVLPTETEHANRLATN